VSIQDVETTLGVTGLKGPDTAGEWPVRACQFNGGSLNLPLVTVRFEVTRDLADFGKIRKFHEENGQATKDLAGLGEAAFTVEVGPAHGVSCLYKKTVLFITTTRAPVDKQIALARMVIQRL
jgi:hypothetical protein